MAEDVRVAAVQLAAQTIDAAESVWPRIERWVRHAAEAGCRLVVIPECSYPAYVLGSAERARAGDTLSQSVVKERFATLARSNRITLVAGFVEDSGGRLWNAAGVWDAGGKLLGVQHKTFLFDCDNRWFSHGTKIEPIDSEVGRIGIVICADARAPEVSATLVNRGAELIVVPTAWVNMARTPGEYWNIQPDVLIRARATEFGVPFVCADKCGHEPPMEYVGQSLIVAADGAVVIQAGPTEETIIIGEVSPARGRSPRLDADLREKLSRPFAALPPMARSDVKIALLPAGVPFDEMRSGQVRSGVQLVLGEGRAIWPPGDQSVAGVYCVAPTDIPTFHAIRALALQGARLILISGVNETELPTLRTRAAENRLFVGCASDERAWLIGPDGQVRGASTHANEPIVLTLDLCEADNKSVTPETNIFQQRRPELYQLG